LLLFYIFVIHSIFWLILSTSISAKLVYSDHTIHSSLSLSLSLSLSPYLSTLVALQIAAESNVVKQKLIFTNIASVYAVFFFFFPGYKVFFNQIRKSEEAQKIGGATRYSRRRGEESSILQIRHALSYTTDI
jgi:Na+/phosphate symporter